ncbi:SH3 domain-containing protein [Leptolyngbya sp. NIES-2104]|uniref:SH3 domain-containing protein n=1 Tax=Leptolyngbya sp. NIES-2104 TaxID=1552121 RepID=UPI0006EC6D58|nr:SH3 domain-containing protein [Leptolyngbya sp. NIES-2104]GAP97281.1 hypothetical protein NIES2104_38280 [Leptolyngbya sp. NIES-2104]
MLLKSFHLLGSAALIALIVGCSSQSPTISTSPTPIVSTSPSTQSLQSSPEVPQATVKKDSRTVEKCVIRMVKVNDPESPLNVRSTPNADSKENIVGQLKNGTFVDVQAEENGWFKISGETPGWIARSRTEHSCNERVERIELGQGSIEIRDRFIGGGIHSYRFKFDKGQRITVTSSSGQLPLSQRQRGSIFPVIIAPDGKAIVGSPDQPSPWTGELPETGEYTFQFESNFKGYAYTFSIDAR